MSRIFLSHSSANNAEAIAIRKWLEDKGWQEEVFLDLDPKRGIAAGERWERRLNEAANRCEAVLFLVSKAWLASGWCRKELNLAHRLNKRLFGVLVEDLSIDDVPEDLSGEWQVVRLASGRDHIMLDAVMPVTHEEVHVTFSMEGLRRLKHGLEQAGLEPKYFAWPPAHDPARPPYRGLRPLEAEDAGIFFGRDAPVIEALDELRGLREAAPPRLLVILGASGAGKSSFLRAGLLPRLQRDDRHFLPLPIIRPERAAINGEMGLLSVLEEVFQAHGLTMARADLRKAVASGAAGLKPVLKALVEAATPSALEGDAQPKPPTLILSIDQGEELFVAEGDEEAHVFLKLLHDLLVGDDPALTALFTIRSDSFEKLQEEPLLDGIRKKPFDLGSMPQGAYAEVIKGPAQRLAGSERALRIEESLVAALLKDIEEGGGKDALPLLAFTLERLYLEFHGKGRLTLADYKALGGIKGSIEAAIERALSAADGNPDIPRDKPARLALLRRGLIPWLAGIAPETGLPRRRTARLSEIPDEARPLINQLVEQRLLLTDRAKDTREIEIEPAHEALLRQWGLLNSWLTEDAGLLSTMEGVKRASQRWERNGKSAAWLNHGGDRLATAKGLCERPDLSGNLTRIDWDYLTACREAAASAARSARRGRALVMSLMLGIIAGLVGWINQDYLKTQYNWYAVVQPYKNKYMKPLSASAEHALKPGDDFQECSMNCPEMIVIPSGSFIMGSPANEVGRYPDEGPQQQITIAHPFAVAKFPVTFSDWDACVAVGGCQPKLDGGYGRGRRPAINISWYDAERYVEWLARMTGKPYRLLSEAEWEYAARAGTRTRFSWGDEVGRGNANCSDCASKWGKQTSPVGSFKPNPFGLFDMHGNVWEWVEDCYKERLVGMPTDGTARLTGNCDARRTRGGTFVNNAIAARSSHRGGAASSSTDLANGFRIARTLGR